MVAGYLAEFDFNFSTQPQYSYYSSAEVFVMRYSRLHLASSSVQAPLLSFTISLYPSGRVLVQYESVVPPSQLSGVYGLPYTRQAAIGMINAPRPASDLLSVFPSPFLASSSDANGLYALQVENEWRPTLLSSGVFPSRALIGGSGSLDFFPFGTNICLAPYFGRAQGGELLHVNPSLTSPYLPLLSLSCAINAQLVPAVYNATFGSFDCLTPLGLSQATVAVALATPAGQLLTSNRVYYTYYSPESQYVQPAVYAQFYSVNGAVQPVLQQPAQRQHSVLLPRLRGRVARRRLPRRLRQLRRGRHRRRARHRQGLLRHVLRPLSPAHRQRQPHPVQLRRQHADAERQRLL